jgi:hypothetical protein
MVFTYKVHGVCVDYLGCPQDLSNPLATTRLLGWTSRLHDPCQHQEPMIASGQQSSDLQ